MELAEDSPFRAREFLAEKDAVTLATDILALNQEQFSTAFRKSPMKRAKLAGLRRNAMTVLENSGMQLARQRAVCDETPAVASTATGSHSRYSACAAVTASLPDSAGAHPASAA